MEKFIDDFGYEHGSEEEADAYWKGEQEKYKPLTKGELMKMALKYVEENQQLRKDLDELIHIVYRANLNRKIVEKEGQAPNHFEDEMTWEAPTGDYLGIPTIHRFAKEIAKKNSIYPYNKEVA